MRRIVFTAQIVLLIAAIVLFPAQSINAPPQVKQSNSLNEASKKTEAVPENSAEAQVKQESPQASKPSSQVTPDTESKPIDEQGSTAVPPQQAAEEKSLTISIPDTVQKVATETLQYNITGGTISIDAAKDKDSMYVIISLSIENTGQNAVVIYPTIMFSLLDQEGTNFSPLLLSEQERALYSKLGPGRALSGQVRFEIPRKPGNYKFGIYPSMDIDAKAIQIPVLIN